MLSLPFLSVKADTCDDVKNFTNEFNSQLPLQVDEITTVTKADYDCRTKNIVIVKEISVTINQLNSKNRLWKSVLKTGWEKQICNLTDAGALTDLGWEFIQRLIFSEGAEHNTIADCGRFKNQEAAGNNETAPLKNQDRMVRLPNYSYFEKCRSFGSNNCYSDIVDSCNRLYSASNLSPEVQYQRMGCLADSIQASLNPSSSEYRSFKDHYILRRAYFEAAIKREISSIEAYQMSEALRNQLNDSLGLGNARQRCLSRCLMNNRAGSGGGAIVQGLNYCANICN